MYVQFAEGMALFHLVFVPYIARQSYVSKKVFLIIWRDGICARAGWNAIDLEVLTISL